MPTTVYDGCTACCNTCCDLSAVSTLTLEVISMCAQVASSTTVMTKTSPGPNPYTYLFVGSNGGLEYQLYCQDGVWHWTLGSSACGFNFTAAAVDCDPFELTFAQGTPSAAFPGTCGCIGSGGTVGGVVTL